MNAPKPQNHRSSNHKKDHWGFFLNRLLRKQFLVVEKMWTLYSRLQCFIWKVPVGRNSRFWGRMDIWRIARSEIIIGEHCRFRSATWSNRVGINRPCALSTMHHGAKITIGNHCGFSGTVISAVSSVEIGDNVLCGANTTITDTDWHHIDRTKGELEDIPCAPVVIEKDVWLGLNVTVLKGVTIGRGSVIAPHSVVNRDIPEFVMAGGQPARVIKDLTQTI